MPWGGGVQSRTRRNCDGAWRRARWTAQSRWAGVVTVLLMVVLGLTDASATAQSSSPPLVESSFLVSGGSTTFYTTTISIPTYPYADYLEDAYNATYNMTYPVLDWSAYQTANPTAVPHTYTLLVLENDYLKVTLLPELGGRVYQIIDKATGHNQLYQNPVIKPTHWGPPEQGWWLAVGGIEWCLPVDEHGYESGIPWSWGVIDSTAGVTVTVQDTTATGYGDADLRLRATVNVFLPSDRGYVVLSPRVENPTDAPVDFKFWINAALTPGAANAPTEGLSFIFSSPEMSVHSTGDARLPGAYPTMPTAPDYRFNWPQHEGVDYSQLRNWNEWLGFFEYPHATKGFIGVYDSLQREGMVRVFPPETAKGTKAFAMGWSHPLDWHTWTDQASGYVELHGGLVPTFWDTARLGPHSTKEWREVWYPVRDIGSVSVATEEAALRATKAGDLLQIAVKPTRAWAAGATELFVWQRTTCTELAHWTMLGMDPGNNYRNTLTVGTLTPDEIAMAYVAAARTPSAAHHVLAAYGPSDCLDIAVPAAHLGYGVNVRDISHIPQLVEPMEFEWVKLWDEYGGFPSSVLPQKVLYNVGCGAYVDDLDAWRSRIRSAAQAGLDKVQAYEICNEPNIRGPGWGGNVPDPAHFAQMVCIAHDEIKAVDPHALVISGGLAPVGRIPVPWSCGEGNNCDAMDEWIYLEAMLDSGAGACMDAFGYHSYGFASPPERDPDLVSNAFAFRGVEKLRDILVARGLADLPVWATEFNWIRIPAEDGHELNCDANADYRLYFKWQEVTAQTQADYLVRAFQYADIHWPWMQGMVVWNLDWHDYMPWQPCFHSRYYALRRLDGTSLGAPTPAYTALTAMDKRPWPHGVPVLSVQPAGLGLIGEVGDPKVLTASLTIFNAGPGVLTWTVALSPTGTLLPGLSATRGSQGDQLRVTVDTHGLVVGYYTATLKVDAVPEETLGRPKLVDVTLHVVTKFQRAYLPAIMRKYIPPTPPSTNTPHGPSKIGTHALAEGGTLELVRQVHDAGGHVALVKGLSFGYLCDVEQISPQTVTVGRWSHSAWEAVVPEGDPAAKARETMQVHMQQWAPYRSCVDYWEVLNEPDPPTIAGHAWLGEFFKAAMSIAEANGYKLALFSYSMGVPEIYEWQAIAETGVFARAKAGGHILSLHEYGGPLLSDRWGEPMPQYPGQPLDDPSIPRYPDRGVLGGRYRHLYRDILIPRGEVIPLALTEVNLNIWDLEERAPYFLDDIAWYDDRLREDDYVLGSAIFTLGGGIAGWGDFDYYEFLPDLAQRIIALKDQ